MKRKIENKPAFYVVQFIELPFEGIDDYVCVPYSWVIARKETNQSAVAVAYPKDEDPFDTRDRAKRKEIHNHEWKSYMAYVKRESNSYSDLEFWIATRNDYGPLIEEESRVTDKQPKLIPIQEPVKKRLRSMNMERNLAIAAQNPSNSINHIGHLSTCSVEQPPVLTQNQSQNNPQVLRTTTGNGRDQTAPLRNIGMISQEIHRPRINFEPFNDLAVAHPRNVLQSVNNNAVATSQQERKRKEMKPELTQQRQMQPNQLDSQQQPQRPKLHIGSSVKPKDRKQMPTLQGITKKTPIQTNLLNSIRQALSTQNDFLSNNPQLQARMSPRCTGDNNEDLTTSHACQTDKFIRDETLSPYHAVTSNSDAVADDEEISDNEMSTDEPPVDTTNNFYGTANDPGHGSADRPTAAQNSTARSNQMNQKFILEQQMLDHFATLFTQMGSTLRYTTDMYNTLRSSIHDTADIYKKLLGAVEQFNAASNASTSSNLRPERPRSPEERRTKVTARASSSFQDQHSNEVANETPKNKRRKLYRFVLPPEYDAYDTRWTLKYRTTQPGLAELMPQSGVYVSSGNLNYCQQVSKDCKSLALRLLSEVFNRNALSICSSMSETAQAAINVGSNIRPDLDDHACSVLLNFVLEHGLQRGWNTDLQPILNTLHSKMEEIRFKYGVMVEC